MANKDDIIDDDLVEEIDDEEMAEIVEEGRKKAYEREAYEKKHGKPKRRFPKWVFWLISLALAFNVVALLPQTLDRKSTRLNSSHVAISYAVFCLKKKNTKNNTLEIVSNK